MQNFRHVAQKLRVLRPKNTVNLHFSVLLEENIARKSYLKFDLEAEIWHGDSLSTWELVCKILCRWFKAFGQSDLKSTRVPKNAAFWDPFFGVFKVFFQSYSYSSATKFCVQVNIPMEICSWQHVEFLKKFSMK